MDKTQIRNAATVIVLRSRHSTPQILMGQRGAQAVFMPNKFVFPGGAVDPDDAAIPTARPIGQPCADRLAEGSTDNVAHALTIAAIRELFEETGQVLGAPGSWPGPVPKDWAAFAATGHLPDAAPLQYVFRAITPPGRPRRFDARFFLIDAEAISSDIDDFSAASDELSHLQWVALDEARQFDMPFITEVVLAEIAGRLGETAAPASVPFFDNSAEESLFQRIYGRRQDR